MDGHAVAGRDPEEGALSGNEDGAMSHLNRSFSELLHPQDETNPMVGEYRRRVIVLSDSGGDTESADEGVGPEDEDEDTDEDGISDPENFGSSNEHGSDTVWDTFGVARQHETIEQDPNNAGELVIVFRRELGSDGGMCYEQIDPLKRPKRTVSATDGPLTTEYYILPEIPEIPEIPNNRNGGHERMRLGEDDKTDVRSDGNGSWAPAFVHRLFKADTNEYVKQLIYGNSWEAFDKLLMEFDSNDEAAVDKYRGYCDELRRTYEAKEKTLTRPPKWHTAEINAYRSVFNESIEKSGLLNAFPFGRWTGATQLKALQRVNKERERLMLQGKRSLHAIKSKVRNDTEYLKVKTRAREIWKRRENGEYLNDHELTDRGLLRLEPTTMSKKRRRPDVEEDEHEGPPKQLRRSARTASKNSKGTSLRKGMNKFTGRSDQRVAADDSRSTEIDNHNWQIDDGENHKPIQRLLDRRMIPRKRKSSPEAFEYLAWVREEFVNDNLKEQYDSQIPRTYGH